jgi:glycosyltransferase involved in cell wall biosynthesis
MDIKLSFILPVYNVEKYLKNCLDSLYRQELSMDEFEVICVNDGSTDKSLDILEEYQRRYPNFRVKSIPNSGQSKARNVGIDMARGTYLEFVDSDDYLASGGGESST